MAEKYVLDTASNGEYYFTLHARNGEPILTGETYVNKQGASDGIQSVRTNCPYDARYVRKTSSRGLPYFTLTAANGQVIGTGEEYSSAAACEGGIAAVKTYGPIAPVEDKT